MSTVDYPIGLSSASAEIAEAHRAARIRRLSERTYRGAIAATDWVIGRLEQLNLDGRGKERLGRGTAEELERALTAVPTPLRPRLRARSVQSALDAVLDLQEPLLEGRRLARSDERWLREVLTSDDLTQLATARAGGN